MNSDAEFISKIGSGLQALEETIYRRELLVEAEIFSAQKLENLQKEAEELMAMVAASAKTVKSRE